jgi:uncharacterized membrane protein YqhA
MLITVAGAQYLLRTGNGLSSLQQGIDGSSLVWPKLAHRSVDLLTVRRPRGLSSNPGIVVKSFQLHGNEKPRRAHRLSSSCSAVSSSSETSSMGSGGTLAPPIILPEQPLSLEERIEMIIFNCRFFTLMAVAGSLAGSVLCFLKGGVYVFESFRAWYSCFLHQHATGKVILLLVEALDVYLMGTVMLIFGMGLYGLFISSLDVSAENTGSDDSGTVFGSNLFGLFKLQERPKWLKIQSLEELKAKLGHVIVMVLLVGMFDKSKKIPIDSPMDLLCLSLSVLLCSGCLYLLSKLRSVD